MSHLVGELQISWTDRRQENDRMVGTLRRIQVPAPRRDGIAGALRRLRPTHQSWESLLITLIPQQEAGKGIGSKTCGQQWPAVPVLWKPTFPSEKLSPRMSLCSRHRQCLSTVYSHLVRVSMRDCWPEDISAESQIDCELRWEHPHWQHHSPGRHPVRVEKVS